ncbi:hypothetical protein FB192DRAFT_1390944 [Mucor lusitanicus]|uniref:Ubiquitin-like domain-containing protein n=1 Tax=Mucor circinelloides f. lusitanicus TaxID=29924 RepID=A0A8H4BE01_MUCCL|nr:hypothetical protein FB192DRAFT_1390944 [Mucor lusitanicus]
MNEFADIHIRWNNGQDLLLNVSLYDDNMGAIKQLIRKNAVEQTSKKTIRLIHRGQLLNNDLYTLSDYGIQQQTIFIHCALSDPIIPTNIIHDIETTDKDDSISGFDKLRESGYNQEEIRSIRLQFHQMQPTSNYVDGEPPSVQDLQLEEEWMEHTGGRRLPEGCKMHKVHSKRWCVDYYWAASWVFYACFGLENLYLLGDIRWVF